MLKGDQLLGPELVGLVIGAGGAGRAAGKPNLPHLFYDSRPHAHPHLLTVHALHEAGVTPIYLYNRTRQTAEDVVFSFPSSYNILLIDDLSASSFVEGLPVAIVGTLPAKATYVEGDEAAESQVFIPRDGLLREGGCVVVDMAYLPRCVSSHSQCT
jgi:shikimate 5-dehydrogenase